MPNVTYGARVRGLLEYLWGPGKSDEHRHPHIVAGYDDPAVLAPPRHPQDVKRWDLTGLAGRLDAPQLAAGQRGMRQYVWQCSLSLPPYERKGAPLDDETWGRIAARFVAEMGFTGDDEHAGCRWIAVRHGVSQGGNDHLHLVVTLATEDGAPIWLWGDMRRSQQVCDTLETEFGLGKWGVRRDNPATRRPAVSRAEMDRATRDEDGQPSPQRAVVRRAVRAALAGARDEADWVARMHAGGLQVAAHPRHGHPDALASGYSVALPPAAGGKWEWFAGRTLDGDLSLPQVRQRWAGESLTVAAWTAIPVAARALSAAARMEVWRRTAAALGEISERVREVPVGSGQWPAIARSCADVLARVAVTVEPETVGPVSRAADILLRAAVPRRADPRPVRSPIADDLARAADALLMTGSGSPMAPGRGEVAVMRAIVVAASGLVVALGQLRQAQQQVHAAGAAQAAAARLLPLLEGAAVLREVGEGEPAVTDRAVTDRDTVRAVRSLERLAGRDNER